MDTNFVMFVGINGLVFTTIIMMRVADRLGIRVGMEGVMIKIVIARVWMNVVGKP